VDALGRAFRILADLDCMNAGRQRIANKSADRLLGSAA
jgi:hypothetical protein